MKARFCFFVLAANLVFSSLFAQSKNLIFITTDPENEYEQVEFLEKYGFSVTPFWPGLLADASQGTIDMLNAADLIIIGLR